MYREMRNFRRCVTAGRDHACALRRDTTLWCWGCNAAGELGLDSTAEQHRARQVTA